MERADEHLEATLEHSGTVRDPERQRFRPSVLVWAGVTIALLLFVFFGSVPAHSWRWNVLRQRPEERVRSVRVTDIWERQRDSLPSLASDAWTTGLFNVVLILFVVGAILGLWLALRVNEAGSVRSESLEPVADGEQRAGLKDNCPASATERTGSQTLA